MPKKVEDVVRPKRSIRDIPVPDGRRRLNMLEKEPVRPSAPDMSPPTPPRPPMPPTREEYIYQPPKRSRRPLIWIAAAVAALILAFAGFSLFSGATLAYVPRTATLNFNSDTYTAVKSADPGSGKLLFSVIQLDGSKSAQAPASGSEQVSVKSSGTIVVYNNSDKAQPLVATTRFQTTDGKIFRIKTGITVPAKKLVGGDSQPGSVEAVVYADQPGADYNIGLSDFTIPGLKDTPQYTAVYARSKTAMTGGFVGTRGKVSDSDMTKAKSLLDSALKDELLSQAKAQVPADFVLFPDLSQVTYDNPSSGSSTATQVIISEHANFTGVIFKKSELAAYLATQKLDKSAPGGVVEITDFSALTVSASGTKPDLLNASSITFQLSGSAPIMWVTDEKSLSSDLAGKNKTDLPDILKNYPSIESATARVTPFWKSSFPNNPAKIKIEANGPKQ